MELDVLKYKINKRINRVLGVFFKRINLSFFFKEIETDLLILDDFFPCPLSNFRYIEFNTYLQNYNALVLTTGKSLPIAQVYKSINKFIKIHPYKNRIKIFREERLVKAKLAVLVFQHNTEKFLDYLERNEIPFIFTLYPGGNFKLDDKQGEILLRRIFNSIYFKRVIVTQKITKDYLVEQNLCPVINIEFIYGCPIELNQQVLYKKFESKIIFNICFVAAKYHPTGMDKGYDIFIETAKKLCKTSSKFKFHVIGGFNCEDIDITEIIDYIQFYGYMDINILREFYENMDIILSPNRSDILSIGAFDGFPTAAVIEAGIKGVIMMLTDDRNQNIYFKNEKDCIFINHNANDICDAIIELCNNNDLMNSISNNGQNTLQTLFSHETQLKKRIEIIDLLIK
jgi:glycosyltransferase involved in cell wall biosynthesis